MNISNSFPDWGVELVETVCKEYNRALPGKLLWSHKDRDCSSGHTFYGHSYRVHTSAGKIKTVKKPSYISVVSGKDTHEHKVVLLHELAHHILAKRKPQGHTVKFWTLVVELNEKYGNLEDMYKREIELYKNPSFRKKARAIFADTAPTHSKAL